MGECQQERHAGGLAAGKVRDPLLRVELKKLTKLFGVSIIPLRKKRTRVSDDLTDPQPRGDVAVLRHVTDPP
jgi:hypothetical protein